MDILNREAITAFTRKHPLSRKPLSCWLDIPSAAVWKRVIDVQRDFSAAKDVEGYVVFNIHGNYYRLIAVIRYERQQVLIHEVLTHSDYDRWKP